jgi:hypothetical protein
LTLKETGYTSLSFLPYHLHSCQDIRLSATDFDSALKDFVPFSLKDVKLQSSSVKWSDIGGLQDVRRTLRETLEWPVKYAAIFKQSPLRLRSGCVVRVSTHCTWLGLADSRDACRRV